MAAIQRYPQRNSRSCPNSFRALPMMGENLKRKLGISRCPVIRSAKDVGVIFQHIAHYDREIMIAGTLDCKNRLLNWTLLAVGCSEWLMVRVGDAFADAIRLSASGIFLVHNHPSGSLEPSREDLVLTRSVSQAGRLLGYPLFDHVIIARDGYRGLITPPKRNMQLTRMKQMAAASRS
jgi:DNA repair protein RadC